MSESFVGFRYSLMEINKRGSFNSAGYLHSITGVGYVIKYLLQLPAAGLRNNNNGSLSNVGTVGYYWSSTINGTNAWNLYFDSGYYNTDDNDWTRANGLSVRCVSELNVNLYLYYGMAYGQR